MGKGLQELLESIPECMDLYVSPQFLDGPGDPEFSRLRIDKRAESDALDNTLDDDGAACTHRKFSKNLWSYTSI